MKKIWLKKVECTGCGACENICPKNAIRMKEDIYGFKYPEIDENCIDCNLCEKVCKRRINLKSQAMKTPKVYAAWSKNQQIRFESTSGGAFSEIANAVLARDGMVVGAHYGKDNMVEHVMVNSITGLNRIRQSKYTQSYMGMIYKQVKSVLDQGLLVLFCGTPCHIAALYAYLNDNYEKLVTIDFICRGVNSTKAYRAWLDEIENECGDAVTRVWFKYKVKGWKNSPRCTRLDFQNGNHKIFDGKDNLFMNGYLDFNLYIRPSCGNCDFKGIKRQSDITLADFWGIEAELDDNQGTSLIMVNSEKGGEWFKLISDNLITQEKEVADIFGGNVCFDKSVMLNPAGNKFLKNLDNMKFSEAIKRYAKKNTFTRIRNKIYKLMKQI